MIDYISNYISNNIIKNSGLTVARTPMIIQKIKFPQSISNIKFTSFFLRILLWAHNTLILTLHQRVYKHGICKK